MQDTWMEHILKPIHQPSVEALGPVSFLVYFFLFH